jgi:hypothetical protein
VIVLYPDTLKADLPTPVKLQVHFTCDFGLQEAWTIINGMSSDRDAAGSAEPRLPECQNVTEVDEYPTNWSRCPHCKGVIDQQQPGQPHVMVHRPKRNWWRMRK